MTGLPPNFRLNLTQLQKKASSPEKEPPQDDYPENPPENVANNNVKRGGVIPPRVRPGQNALRGTATLARKNLVLQSDSDDDDDEDLELESIPVGKEAIEPQKEDIQDEVEAPVVQVSHLPELDVDEDDEYQSQGQGNKYSILYDLLISPEQADEPPEEWSYRQFIKQFANSEAAQENADDDGDEYEQMYDDEESENDGYDE